MLDSIDLDDYFSYNGSLTTPPCTEGIKWSVMNKIQTISPEQLVEFTSLLADDPTFAGGNGSNRLVQDVNDRTIYSSTAIYNALDEEVEDKVDALVDSTGDFVKSVLHIFDVSFSLAQDDAQTESNSNNYSNAYTGAVFGVVGLAATFVLIGTCCNKKEVSERQSSILDGYQNANHL